MGTSDAIQMRANTAVGFVCLNGELPMSQRACKPGASLRLKAIHLFHVGARGFVVGQHGLPLGAYPSEPALPHRDLD